MKYYSKHTFMFPFQWDFIKNKRKDFYSDRTNLKDFDKIFQSLDNGFQLKKFEILDDTNKYNEFVYFHSFARKALYYTEDKDLLRYYELEGSNGSYNIEYLDNNETKKLLLKLDSICVHIYETGVGVVSFNITNDKYDSKEDVLKINEFGRRLYPQFMTENNRLGAKNAFLPQRIYGEIGNLTFDEDFSQYNDSIQSNTIFLPPCHIRRVFGYKGEEQIGDIGQKFVFRKEDELKNTIRIRPITDDRMFFLCWYGNNQLANDFTETLLNNDKSKNQITTLNYWYAFIFGDKKDPSVGNVRMQQQQIEELTYTRWLNYGTLFGVTRDSFVGISSDKKTLEKLNLPIDEHMQTMYYQMAILCLVQRASILRFSWEISQITNRIFRKKHKTDPEKAIRELYENYIRFINQIYFREVTPQIQGIELYTMFQQQMNLEKGAKDLDSEMQELFNYLSVNEQTHLGKVANLFLPLALVTGFFGMNAINENLFKYKISEIGIDFGNTTFYDVVIVILAIWTLIVIVKYVYRIRLKK